MSHIMLDTAARRAIIDTVAAKIEEGYVFPEIASQIAAHLRSAAPDTADMMEATQFRDWLNAQLQQSQPDPHLVLYYSAAPLNAEHSEPEQAEIAQVRGQMATLFNCGVHRAERLAGNIGYLDVRAFEDPLYATPVFAAAMRLLANTFAVIIDLRQNQGGHPGAVALLCSYFFGETPVHLNSFYWRAFDDTEDIYTLRHVDAPRYLDKPMYVLTGAATFSAAEEFAYDLQSQKRAVIIGEATKGGAHLSGEALVHPHFVLGLPSARAINPITGTNWNGAGVQPDIVVPVEQALKRAHVRALEHVRANVQGSGRAYEMLMTECQICMDALSGESDAQNR